MSRISRVLAVPLVGPFHTRFPRYNAVDVRDAIRASGVTALALAPLAPGALRDPAWQATDEISLPLAVVPWALQAGLALHEVGAPGADASGPEGAPAESGSPIGADATEQEFDELLGRYEAGREHLLRVRAAEEPVKELLGRPLDLGRVWGELLPAVDAYHLARAAEFGEGPGTGWRQARAAAVAERVLALPHERVALLASVDQLPELLRALGGRAAVELLEPAPEPSDEARSRALLDVAMRGDPSDPAQLLAKLRELGTPEAAYLEANVLLEHDHLAEALEALERVMRTDFQEPYYLPGFLLARIGQVYDLAGRRDAALRSYRGVLALSFAQPEAQEVARAGLVAAFGADDGPAEDRGAEDGPSEDADGPATHGGQAPR